MHTDNDPSSAPSESPAGDAERRAQALESFRDLLARLDTALIEEDETADHRR
jgi:hypothetical protein